MPSDTATDLTPWSLEQRAELLSLKENLDNNIRLIEGLVPGIKININATPCFYLGLAEEGLRINVEGNEQVFLPDDIDLLSVHVPEPENSNEYFAYQNALLALKDAKHAGELQFPTSDEPPYTLQIPCFDFETRNPEKRKAKEKKVGLIFELGIGKNDYGLSAICSTQVQSRNPDFKALYVPALSFAATKMNLDNMRERAKKYGHSTYRKTNEAHTNPLLKKSSASIRGRYRAIEQKDVNGAGALLEVNTEYDIPDSELEVSNHSSSL